MMEEINRELTEKRVREIVREEVWKILTEISERKLKDIEKWQKIISSLNSDLL